MSIVVDQFPLSDIRKHIPDLSKYKFTAERKHASLEVGAGQQLEKGIQRREKLNEQQLNHFLEFIMSPAVMTDAPYGNMNLKLSSGEKMEVPKIILNSVRTRVVEQYLKFCEENNFAFIASHRSYMRILEAVSPSIRKCMKGLDNYAAEGAQGFEDLQKVLDVLQSLGKDFDWVEETKKSLSSAKQYLKLEYKLHLSNASNVADHCIQYALSTSAKEFFTKCNHCHNQSCPSCDNATHVASTIQNAVSSTTYTSEDQQDDILYTVSQSIKAIEEWKMHILRTYNQDLARTKNLENLSQHEVFIERDWAMKFLPMMYRESQSKWFGKRGLNWHISVATHIMNGNATTHENAELVFHTIVHVFDNATQDAHTSNAILEDTLCIIKSKCTQITDAYVRSDNAGCFHGHLCISGVADINERTGIQVRRLDFADPQGGKSICDRRAAHIKSAIRKYVNEGNDVRTGIEFLKALERSNMPNLSIALAVPRNIKSLPFLKLKDVMSLNNFEYGNDCVRVWRQYQIGCEKLYDIPRPEHALQYEPAIEILERIETRRSKPRCIPEHPQSPLPENEDKADENERLVEICNNSAVLLSSEDNPLFSCPEIHYCSTFSKYGNLLKHLDLGKHNIRKKSERLGDRTKILYREKMERKIVYLPFLQGEMSAQSQESLIKGWALKRKREVKRFSDYQKKLHNWEI